MEMDELKEWLAVRISELFARNTQISEQISDHRNPASFGPALGRLLDEHKRNGLMALVYGEVLEKIKGVSDGN